MELFQTEFFKGILGEPGSHVPSFPIIFGYSIWAYHKLTGLPAYEIMKDGKKHAAAQLYVANEFDLPFELDVNQSYILQVTCLCPNGRRLSDEFALKLTQ